jgi:hypothetical protein
MYNNLIPIPTRPIVRSTAVTLSAGILTVTLPDDSLVNNEWLSFVITQQFPPGFGGGAVQLTDGSISGFLLDWTGSQVYGSLIKARTPYNIHKGYPGGTMVAFLNFSRQIPHIFDRNQFLPPSA